MSVTELFIKPIRSYKVVILYGVLFSINSLASCIILAFAKVQFKDMATEDWVVVICSIIMNWTGSILALLNKAFAKSQQPGGAG